MRESLCDFIQSETWTDVHLNPNSAKVIAIQQKNLQKDFITSSGNKCQQQHYLNRKWLCQLNSVITISQAEE